MTNGRTKSDSPSQLRQSKLIAPKPEDFEIEGKRDISEY